MLCYLCRKSSFNKAHTNSKSYYLFILRRSLCLSCEDKMKRSCFYVLFFSLIFVVGCQNGSNSGPIYEEVSAGRLNPGDAIPAPTNEVLLTISGKITQTNVDDTAQFDLATLESLHQVQYDVNDPFAQKQRLFSGVLMSELLEIVGVDPTATTLELIALNDYASELAISDVQKWPILFAMKADGQYLPLDGGGPAIIVFPFDDFPEIDNLTYEEDWVWSMTQIVVK